VEEEEEEEEEDYTEYVRQRIGGEEYKTTSPTVRIASKSTSSRGAENNLKEIAALTKRAANQLQ
jgi:hypothetical protein